MNRSQVGGNLPETDLSGLKWRKVKDWISRIQNQPLRQSVERNLQRIRGQNRQSG
jgi:hypothetical protein